MWHRIREIIKKEVYQTLREPRMRMLLFVPPMIQLIVFGFAVNLDVERSPIAWMDLDRTPISRELLQEFTASGRFQLVAFPSSQEEMQGLLDRGKAQATIQILPGFSRNLQAGKTAPVQILIDGTNSNTASIVADYAAKMTSRFSSRLIAERQKQLMVGQSMQVGGPVGMSLPAIQSQARVWFNEDLRSRNYYVPGVIVNIIALVTVSLTALSIVREKEIGTMEQLLVTPIRPVELLLGKMLPFAVVGVFEVLFIVLAALLVFQIPLRGNLLVLLVCAAFFLMTTLGVGLFISTVSHTQQQAMMASFLFFTPAFMLSGFAFPIRNMPPIIQVLTYLNPIRYFMEIVRGIFLKGTGIPSLWPQILALILLGTGILALSSFRFHKRLD